MNKVYDLTHQLARAIKDSQEYRDFIEKKESLAENQKNKEMVEDFQEKILKFQMDYMSGQEVDQEEVEKLGKLEEVLNMNPAIKDYFQAELRFSQMMQDINGILGDAIDLEIE